MPETSSSNADALVLATAFPHATEAQRAEILTDLFVRRVVIPRGTELAHVLVGAFSRYAKRSLRDLARDPIGRTTLREGARALARSFVRDEDIDEVLNGVDSAFDAVFPGATPEATPEKTNPRTHEVTIPSRARSWPRAPGTRGASSSAATCETTTAPPATSRATPSRPRRGPTTRPRGR